MTFVQLVEDFKYFQIEMIAEICSELHNRSPYMRDCILWYVRIIYITNLFEGEEWPSKRGESDIFHHTYNNRQNMPVVMVTNTDK